MEIVVGKQLNKFCFGHSGTRIPFDVALDNVEKAFNAGTEYEIDDALVQLLKLCKNKELPQRDTEKAKSLLLFFLKKMRPAEALTSSNENVNVNEIDQMLAEALKKALLLECEKSASFGQKDLDYEVHFRSIKENQQLHRLVAIFCYLNDIVAHLDDQLFDEACVLAYEKKTLAAQTVFHILLELGVEGAAGQFNNLSRNCDDMFMGLAKNVFRPKCAVLQAITLYKGSAVALFQILIGLAFNDGNEFAWSLPADLTSASDSSAFLESFRKVFGNDELTEKALRDCEEFLRDSAMLQPLGTISGDSSAFLESFRKVFGNDELTEKALRDCEEFFRDSAMLQPLGTISGEGGIEVGSDEESAVIELTKLHTEGRITELKNRDLARSLKEGARAWRSIQSEQENRFGIPYDASVESRIQTGKNYLSEMAVEGMKILLPLTKLDHCKAIEAVEILSGWLGETENRVLSDWLGKTENRVLLMHAYGLLALSTGEGPMQTEQEEYEKKFEHHLTVLLQQVQTLSEQGNKKVARQLVHQLLEKEIELEVIEPHKLRLSSTFYRLLLASPALDNACQKEVQWRLEVIQGKRSISALRNCVDFNAPKRPWANYQLGLILKSGSFGFMLKKKQAKVHFERALSEGCFLAKKEVDELEKFKSLCTYTVLDEAEHFISKHKNNSERDVDKNQYALRHAVSCYKWVVDEFPNACNTYSQYLKYLPEINDVDTKTLLHSGKKVPDLMFGLPQNEIQAYTAVLQKPGTGVEVAAEVHLILARVHKRASSQVGISLAMAAEEVEIAAKHYQRAVELGNEEAVDEEVCFLAKLTLTSVAHPLDENSTIIVRLKAIADNKNKGADKDSIRQAAITLTTHYSTFGKSFSLRVFIGLFDPVALGKKYDDIVRRLNNEIEIEQIEKVLFADSTNTPTLLEAETKNQSHLAGLKHDLAEMYLNAIGCEQDFLKATELIIQAAGLGHQASKEALVQLANRLMSLELPTTPELESLYRLSQVMDTLLSETGIIHVSSDVLLEQAAKMGHPDAKTRAAIKAQ